MGLRLPPLVAAAIIAKLAIAMAQRIDLFYAFAS